MTNVFNTQIKLEDTSGAVGVWNFDEFDDNRALDSSGNSNTGTNYGATGAYLKLDNGTGTATDETNYGLTVTHFNSPVWQANSAPNGTDYSLNFTATSSQYLTISDQAEQRPSGDFSVWCWTKITTLNSPYGLFGKAEGLANKKGYLLYIESTNKFRFAGYNNDGSVNVAEANSAITGNNWHFIIGVYTSSDTTGRIYVNSILQTDTFIANVTHSTGTMTLGRFWNDTTGGSLNGNVAHAGMCARALTQNEITEMYNLKAAKMQDYCLDNGKHGRSMYFRGTNYSLLPNNASLNITGSLTLESWIKTSSVIEQDVIGGYNAAPNYEGYGLQINSAGFVKLWLSGHGVGILGVTAVNNNVWHFITASYNSLTKEVKIYVDGTLDKQAVVTAGPQSWAGQRRIGTAAVSGLSYFVGYIDDPRIYDCVLDDSVIADHADADVTSACVNYDKETTYGQQIATISMNFSKAYLRSLLENVDVPKKIRVWRGYLTAKDEKIFDGSAETITEEAGNIKISGRDKMGDLVKKSVNHDYLNTDAFAGKCSAIAQDLMTTYGGLNADSTTVQDSGTILILESFKCRDTDIFERCKKLADALDWQIYYRPDTDYGYFEPKGFTQNNNVIFSAENKNIIELPKWDIDSTSMINDLTLTGGSQLIETTQLFSGDGATTVFTLGVKPESIKVYYGNTTNFNTTAVTEQYLKTGGIDNSTLNPDYTVDKEKKTVTCTTFTPSNNTNNLAVQYSYYAPIRIHKLDDESIAQYTTYQKTIDLEDIKSVDDAETRASSIFDVYSEPFTICTIKARNIQNTFVRVGQKLRVIDTFRNRDEWLVLNRHKIRYPGDYEELVLGDKEWRMEMWQASIEEKLKRLKEIDKENIDLITEIKDIKITLGIKPENFKIDNRTVSGTDLFLLGDSNYGILGTNKLGDRSGIAYTESYVYNKNNTFREYFKDTFFRDYVVNTYDPYSSTNGLIAWWRMDDNAANTTVTDSIFGNNGTAQQNTNLLSTTGQLGTALTFNGTSDYIDLNPYKTSPLFNNKYGAVSFWIYPDSTMVGTFCAIANYRKVTTTDFIIFRYCKTSGGGSGGANQSIVIYGEVGDVTMLGVQTPTNCVPVDTWSHVTIVQNGSAITVYINGSSVALTGTNSGHWFADTYPASTDFRIGDPGSWVYYMDGKLDEFMIWNRVLTSDEALQLGTSKHCSGAWDTSNQRINLLANQSYTSSVIAYESGVNITSLTVYANTSGSLNWYARTDTNAWEPITLGTAHTFTNAGEKLRIRATESAGSTATINAQIRVIYA